MLCGTLAWFLGKALFLAWIWRGVYWSYKIFGQSVNWSQGATGVVWTAMKIGCGSIVWRCESTLVTICYNWIGFVTVIDELMPVSTLLSWLVNQWEITVEKKGQKVRVTIRRCLIREAVTLSSELVVLLRQREAISHSCHAVLLKSEVRSCFPAWRNKENYLFT